MIDLRYIESLIESEIILSTHPSDERLADFIDKKLEREEREEVVNHLLLCDVCSGIVNQVIEHKKKPKFFNRIIISTPLIALVASIIALVYTPPIEIIGMIDPYKVSLEFRGENASQKGDELIDGDKVLKEISKTTDVTHLEGFNQAEKEKDFFKALGLYQKVINSLYINTNEKDRLKQLIIIRSRILYRAIEENNQEVIDSHRGIIRDDICTYYQN
jgi:hypothetical protein